MEKKLNDLINFMFVSDENSDFFCFFADIVSNPGQKETTATCFFSLIAIYYLTVYIKSSNLNQNVDN